MSKNWTLYDIAVLQNKGFAVKGAAVLENTAAPKSFNKEKSNQPLGIKHIASVLLNNGYQYETEYLFAKPRKYRADFYVPSMNLLIEYEGIYSEKSRHTHYKGYAGDVEKYNLVCIKGYRLLRYTADNYTDFENNLIRLSNGG